MRCAAFHTQAALAMCTLTACGLRTDATDSFYICVEEEGLGGTGTGADHSARPGSCDQPLELPFESGVRRERELQGCSQASGVCGADAGPEDVYRFSVPQPIDVSIRFDPAHTDFVPSLRVTRVDKGEPADCTASDEETDVCLPLDGQRPPGASWFAVPEYDYYIFVDSPPGSRGSYLFELRTGIDAVGERCLDNVIEVDLRENLRFEYEGTLPSRQGFANGRCGGPGAEQMFRLTFPSAGRLRARLDHADFWSVLSLGHSCAGMDQYRCIREEEADEFETLEYVGGSPDWTTYLAVDQQRFGGGDYKLVIELD
ncbi:MAG: hypothetical protein B7733_13235 [Myxococcales bacterium FL481]|nr:MAG: hypothetical protein B7733_13235 [Myxococcales bacterium FL481]